jgi:hypothetical protein
MTPVYTFSAPAPSPNGGQPAAAAAPHQYYYPPAEAPIVYQPYQYHD